MANPDWWPAWEEYIAAQREYEAAVEGIRSSAPDNAAARLEWERIRREILPKRNAAFEVFRAKFLSFHGA